MVRSGQMVLAQALMNLFETSTLYQLFNTVRYRLLIVTMTADLDADRHSPYSTYRQVTQSTLLIMLETHGHYQVLRWFSDNPSTAHPYSIHNIIARNAWIKRQRAAKYNIEYEEKTEEYLYKGGNWLAPSEICQILE